MHERRMANRRDDAQTEHLCVVMPVYNEELAIGDVLRQWHAALTALGIDFEIRVWNDGSRDGSLDAMYSVAKELGNRVVICDKPNEGHGPTILRGYRDAADAGFDWIFQIDSDNEMGAESFGKLWAMRHDRDFLVGRRDGRRQAWPRKIVSWVSRLCVRIFYGKSVWDVNSPYRLMRVSAFEKFFILLPSDTFAPNVILSGLAARNGLRVEEILVPQHDRTTGEVSIRKWKLLKAAAKSFGQTVDFALHGKTLWGWGMSFFLIVGVLFSIGNALLPKTIEMLYDGRCPVGFLNRLISGQSLHPLDHYLGYFMGIFNGIYAQIFVVSLLFFALFALRQQRDGHGHVLCNSRKWWFFAVLATVSMALKFHASLAGWNYDFESYQIVSEIVRAGGNVYRDTYRYNYGPVWFWILGLLRNLPDAGFRYGIIVLLGLADVGLGAILWRRKLYTAASLFFFSNISIHITGFHNQFDNLAVLAALSALLLMECESQSDNRSKTTYWFGVVLLGISIAIKHVFVFMPFWLLFRTGPWKHKLLSCLIPLMLFGLSLIAYADLQELFESQQFTDTLKNASIQFHEHGGLQGIKQFWGDFQSIDCPANGIIKHVLQYRSFDNSPFYHWVLGPSTTTAIPKTLLFFSMMLGLGWISRKKAFFESGLIYTFGIFVFSPAVTMQYYAIPCLAAAVYWFPFGLLYHLIMGGLFSCKNGEITLQFIPVLIGNLLLLGCLVVSLYKEIVLGWRKVLAFLSKNTTG